MLLQNFALLLARFAEVDFVVGDAEVAIEVESSSNVVSTDTKGLRAFVEEHPQAKLLIVSLEPVARKYNEVEMWPATDFLKQLWNGRFC